MNIANGRRFLRHPAVRNVVRHGVPSSSKFTAGTSVDPPDFSLNRAAAGSVYRRTALEQVGRFLRGKAHRRLQLGVREFLYWRNFVGRGTIQRTEETLPLYTRKELAWRIPALVILPLAAALNARAGLITGPILPT